MIKKYFDDLEKRIDPETEDVLLTEWKRCTNGEFNEGFFSPRRRQCAPSNIEWLEVHINDAIEDFELKDAIFMAMFIAGNLKNLQNSLTTSALCVFLTVNIT